MKNDCPLFLPSQVKVDNCRLAGLSSTHSKVMLADVTVIAWNGDQRIFKRVFFIESCRASAWIAGCEVQTLTERHPQEAPIQRELLAFLRLLNVQEQEHFGTVLSPATARQSSEARVTQAYLDARGLQYDLRIGYCGADGVFRVAILMSPPQPLLLQQDSGYSNVVQV